MADWLAGCLGWLAVGLAGWAALAGLPGRAGWLASWLLAGCHLLRLAGLAAQGSGWASLTARAEETWSEVLLSMILRSRV